MDYKEDIFDEIPVVKQGIKENGQVNHLDIDEILRDISPIQLRCLRLLLKEANGWKENDAYYRAVMIRAGVELLNAAGIVSVGSGTDLKTAVDLIAKTMEKFKVDNRVPRTGNE